jgi:hypothetical protein
MPSPTAEPVTTEAERAELQSVLQSPLFARSPALTHLLSYLCEKFFCGEAGHIKEYSLALDVFGRPPSFDQDTDSIVRVEANRLRKRLAEYYSADGAGHRIRLTIPVGQYVPLFQAMPLPPESCATSHAEAQISTGRTAKRAWFPARVNRWLLLAVTAAVAVAVAAFLQRERLHTNELGMSPSRAVISEQVGLPVGNEIRILPGGTKTYVDRAGKLWSPDSFFTGGTTFRAPVQHIWRTQDPTIYRSSRQGDFTYDIPLKPGVYELRLHFAETFYGPEDAGGGGEGSRVMRLNSNGQLLLDEFDALADSGGGRTADVKVFTDIQPAADGLLHLAFSSQAGGRGMVSGIEILPGIRGHIRPIRIVARDVPYYSNDSHWWSSDIYFKGGQLRASEQPADGTDDPDLYETERWGHFSYAIPVVPGKYDVILYFIERRSNAGNPPATGNSSSVSQADTEGQRFNVFCNGKAILQNLNILEEAGENRPLVKKITGLGPNAQGKLLLEFVPVTNYATISAIEVVAH